MPLSDCLEMPSHTLDVRDVADLEQIYHPEPQMIVWHRPVDVLQIRYWAQVAPRVLGGWRWVSPPEEAVLPDFSDLPGRHAVELEIRTLLELFHAVTGSTLLGARIEVSENQVCPRFHTDHVALRLLVTWLGNGTEWVDDRLVDRKFLGSRSGGKEDSESGLLRPGASIQSIPAYAVALLKGSRWPGNEARGALHRSPAHPTESDGIRVLFAIDAVN